MNRHSCTDCTPIEQAAHVLRPHSGCAGGKYVAAESSKAALSSGEMALGRKGKGHKNVISTEEARGQKF